MFIVDGDGVMLDVVYGYLQTCNFWFWFVHFDYFILSKMIDLVTVDYSVCILCMSAYTLYITVLFMSLQCASCQYTEKPKEPFQLQQ